MMPTVIRFMELDGYGNPIGEIFVNMNYVLWWESLRLSDSGPFIGTKLALPDNKRIYVEGDALTLRSQVEDFRD